MRCPEGLGAAVGELGDAATEDADNGGAAGVRGRGGKKGAREGVNCGDRRVVVGAAKRGGQEVGEDGVEKRWRSIGGFSRRAAPAPRRRAVRAPVGDAATEGGARFSVAMRNALHGRWASRRSAVGHNRLVPQGHGWCRSSRRLCSSCIHRSGSVRAASTRCRA